MRVEGFSGIMQGLSYEYDVSKLWLGGSYGNIEIFTRTDARSNLAGLWCAEDDQFYVGRLVMHFAVEGERLEAHTTTFAAIYQNTSYVGRDVEVHKTFFVPYGEGDLPRVFQVVRLRNSKATQQPVDITLGLTYPQFPWAEFRKHPDIPPNNRPVAS